MSKKKNKKSMKEDVNNISTNEIEETIKEPISNNEIREDNKDLEFITKIYNKLTCSNFVKSLSFIFIVTILLLIITFMIPNLIDIPSSYSNLEQERIWNEEYVDKYVESSIVIEELDEEYVLIKNTISNKGEYGLEIIDNTICIEKLTCGDKCKYDDFKKDCKCSNPYIELYNYEIESIGYMEVPFEETKTIEYKVPKKFANKDEYIIKSYMSVLVENYEI